MDFWQRERVSEFANLYGYWDDRLVWINWLIEMAERRGDWSTVVEAMFSKAWTLTLMGQPELLKEAEALLSQAWSFRHHVDLKRQSSILNNTIALHIRQRNYAKASHWLDLGEALLEEAHLGQQEYPRQWVAVLYYRAEKCYGTGDYDQAKSLFQQVGEHSQAIDWHRAVIYTQNWVADIAIAQDNLDEAKSLLQTGLPVAERNKDKRRTAFYKRSFAYLKQKQGDLAEALRWAEAALDGFERLGMQPEAEEMRELVQLLRPAQN
jgi:LuxR family glucitol operon transcriptional activator